MKNLTLKKTRQFLTFLFILSLSIGTVEAQNLLKERIRRISTRKKSVYLDAGIFHNGGAKRDSKLKAIRHNYSSKRGYERVVLDFATNKPPRIYGYISNDERKLYLDLFSTDVPDSLSSFGDSEFVKAVNFFPIQKDTLSVEVLFKKNVTLDVFYLENPGRLVVDIKG
ncbi:MAG: hypothetical protein VXV96_01420 [Bdellovibrionota bacterium]|nr:hypothetical protein [Bdellovibrionota bacterium]